MFAIRKATELELPALSDLCIRSKAHWGYDKAFIAACRDELTLARSELDTTSLAVGENEGKIVGLAQIATRGATCDLLKLFIEPSEIGNGYGAQLFVWAVSEGRYGGATRMTIEADPDAVPFYRRIGGATHWPRRVRVDSGASTSAFAAFANRRHALTLARTPRSRLRRSLAPQPWHVRRRHKSSTIKYAEKPGPNADNR